MQVVDFSRSFSTFRIDTLQRPPVTVSHRPPFTLNNARIQIECVCLINDKQVNDRQVNDKQVNDKQVGDRQTQQRQQFVLGASCKTERVGVDRDIWTEPNADYQPIYSPDRYLSIKTWARADMRVMLYPPSLGWQSERQTGKIADAYESVRVEVAYCDGEELAGAAAIVQATLAGRPLVGRTIIDAGRYRAELQYPIKTINANERDAVYQTDTGPILFPDFEREPDDLITGMELAFIAFNAPTWAEVIVRVPTRVAEGVDVYHYSRPVRLDCNNAVFAAG